MITELVSDFEENISIPFFETITMQNDFFKGKSEIEALKMARYFSNDQWKAGSYLTNSQPNKACSKVAPARGPQNRENEQTGPRFIQQRLYL